MEMLKERHHLEDLGIDRIIILRRILIKYCGKLWIGAMWIMTRPMAAVEKLSAFKKYFAL
jgi:hypothetical protein